MKRRVRLDAGLAAAALAHMPPHEKRRMKKALRALGDDATGRSSRLDVKLLDLSDKLPRLYRLRVGMWRAIFAIRDRDIIVTRIFHRSEGYGWLERLDSPGRPPVEDE